MSYEILQGDVQDKLRELPPASVQTVVTSPPYWGLRDYGVEGQLGLESSPDDYVQTMVAVFRAVRRVLKDDGTVWLNLGDAYTSGGRTWRASDAKLGARAMEGRASTPEGLKPKDLVGIPWRVAFALQADGWYLRSDIIWHKPNPMPESVTDRPTKAHEYLFLLTKQEKYYYDHEAVKEPASNTPGGRLTRAGRGDKGLRVAVPVGTAREGRGLDRVGVVEKRNKRSVWTITTQPFKGAHFATMPEKLVEPCVLAGSREGDTVLDPFAGSGTVGVVALHHTRKFIGVELNPAYVALAHDRIEAGSRKLAA